MKVIVCVAIFVLAGTFATAAQHKSVYTSISEKGCKTLHSNPDEGGSYLGECRGIAGYRLQVVEGDIRQSINVIAPSGRKSELNLWNIRSGFSSLGPSAEWRLKAGKPIALIVRFNVSENPENSAIITSYLVIAKITRSRICVTDLIDPSKDQNTNARLAAYNSASRKCGFE